MKKSERIAALVAELGEASEPALDARYTGYFKCFNARDYYEAHDVLEDLWLQTPGDDHRFFKGLIQFAGAFVHLQKHFQHPGHAKHGRRLRPADRLFHLALANLEPYGPVHLRLDVKQVCALGRQVSAQLVAAQFEKNPWHPMDAPQLHLFAK